MIHRSVSQLDDYRCPYAFRLKRVDRVPRLPAAWKDQGTWVHAALLDQGWEASGRSLTIRECQDVFSTGYEAAVAAARQEWPDESLWLRGGNLRTDTDIQRRGADGRTMVEGYIGHAVNENLTPFMLHARPAVELKFEWEIGRTFDGHPLIIVGYLDAIYEDSAGNLLIRDLKCGAKKPWWDLQLWTYIHAAREVFGLDVEWAEFFMVRYMERIRPAHLSDMSRERLAELFISMDAAERLAGHYMPTPGDGCRFCDVKHVCPFSP